MADKKRGPGRPPGSKNKKTLDREAKEAKARQQKKAEAAVKKKGSESKAREKAQEIQAQKKADRRVIDEIWAIIVIAIGAFFIVSIFTTGAGQVGSAISDFLKGAFGLVAYGLPFFLILLGILLFARQTVSISIKSALLTVLLLSMIATMNAVRFIDPENITFTKEILKGFYTEGILLHSGGFIGMLFGSVFIKFFGVYGCWIITVVVAIICLLLIINTPVSRFFKKISEKLEERKLIKENAVLDLEDEEEQERANDEARAAFISAQSQPVFTKREELKEEIKIIGAKEHFENNEQDISKEEKAKFEAEKRKKNILAFVNDDNLFGDSEYSGTYGLEEKSVTERGKGLDLNNDGKIDRADFEYGIKTYSEEAENNPSPRARTYMDDYQIGVSGLGHGMGYSKDDDNIYETPEKLTNKEAREAMLKKSDINKQAVLKNYKKPPLSLLKKPESGNKSSVSALKAKAEKLESTLRSFNVDAKVIQVIQGPTVTRYEIQPSIGVKVSKIVNLADDIALNLEAKSIRIEAPIPGKAAVGIEIENDAINMVRASEIIGSSEFKEAKSKISFAVGKDIGGKAIVADLKSMPHLLIAGATGSGKSVCINTIITSLMYKAKPDEVKLILIDPKVVELGNYNGIPHLMVPVVTDASKAAASLNWAVSEMTDRYKKFAECGVRDLESYNEWVIANDEKEKVLPQVVIIIDELADLMMAAPSQIEDSICRLAQMARAAGMHLIVATQRPSVDVITGVIKANIPSRIAFAVSSHVDSMTILDMKGAESLVGKGDMLFYPMGNSKPIRVQGAFISDQEVSSVIEFVKGQVDGGIDYNEEILARIERSDCQSSEEETDDLLMDCIELVVNQGQASVSMLQRRFRIGYNRAARIMDIMEDKGIVGPQDGSRPRQVLLTESEFLEIKQEAMESE